MKKLSRRDQERLLKRLGINLEEVEGIKEVRLVMESKTIIIKNPTVFRIRNSEQSMYQIVGEEVEGEIEEKKSYEPSEEDILLVAQQTGKSVEEAKSALKMTGGDLAQAIMLLKNK
ncbi:MAG: nascent polypeptide-associated complex protein [Thermoproteota archaeon]|nr:NagC family transcriptional regulator [Candidatus Brockarchaeota archaeon]MBO3762840.1 NagC family transcriptional regulator [Candidatus Brockarchaeota archaeon]MBO3768401.1 NagC family transcriptional regulator [Candidatus Brockarchaeota archaeon]MBO3801514.1 NagC family transcriptional regulator [Candidatus Brockarchaeota archaeon]